MTGVQPPELANAPELPELAGHLWRYFAELHADRMAPGQPPARITPTAMRDFEWSAGVVLDLWERRALKRLDATYFKSLEKSDDDGPP